jgi:hypothetical protein
MRGWAAIRGKAFGPCTHGVVLLLMVFWWDPVGRLVPLNDLHGILNRRNQLDTFIWLNVARISAVVGECAQRSPLASFVHARLCLVVLRMVELLFATV